MRIRPAGEHALLVEFADTRDVAAWHAELQRRHTVGDLVAVDIVPAARTVLLDGLPDPAAVTDHLTTWPPPPPVTASAGPLVEIPTVYDGPDLAEVARHWRTTSRDVVALHTGIEFRVAFCGFAPGFGYLAGLPLDRTVPRRTTPRERVPVGAVGLAGEYTGVYPTASPGGWQLIGHTGTVLFDPDRDPPALFSPGTRVRFVETAQPDSTPPPRRRPGPWSLVGASATLEVVRAGALTTVQDLGRPGFAHLGVPRSGALDAPALRLANRLVGNPEDAAGLETTATGCTVRLPAGGMVAVTGALADVRRDGRPVPWGLPVYLPPGATVTVGPARAGLRSYLAFAGGVTVPPVLGSRATDTLAGLGPPPLADGDVLPLGAPRGLAAAVDVAPYRPPDTVVTLRIRRGPRDDWFTDAAVETLLTATYTVSPVSNRVGARLSGPPLHRAVTGELPSEGLVTGAVQVPADGQPLVFLADHPTTGGYPVVAVVADADLPALAQARPGTTVRFREGTLR